MIAQGALLIWPLVTLMLMLAMPTRRAIMWSLLAGYLVLPIQVGFDFSGVPALDKTTIPNLATFVLAMALARRGEFRWPRSMTINLLMALYLISPIVTGLGNRAPLQFGAVIVPGMSFYDSLSQTAYNMIDLMPFVLGLGFLRDERSHRELLFVMVAAALVYSIPILMEIRLSPQLQRMIYGVDYGIFFAQNMRSGGFRAMVFLGHGLLVGSFLAVALVAAAGLWRMRRPIWGVPAGMIVAYLVVVLLLNKALTSVLLALLIVPALYLLRPRRFLTFTLILASIVFTYPMLRAWDMVPTDMMKSVAGMVSTDRQESLSFRLDNEDSLLNRASEKSLLGWGAWGRNRVIARTEFGGFRDASVTDGTWIIAMGSYGWLGYISMFGLLCYPAYHAFRQRKRGISFASTVLVAMLIINLLDLIPNSSLRPLTWLIAGAVAGVSLAPLRRTQAKVPPMVAQRMRVQSAPA